MQPLRSDLWCAAFVRRHNDQGRFCVVARRGDPVAGQIWVEIEHLNGTTSLFTPAPSVRRPENSADHIFECRYDHVEPKVIAERIARETGFDPDLWVLALELRDGGADHGLRLVPPN
ncbi:MAG TPA: DUF1491 family protein [Devosiaceae bacterium]